jgi:all-trans-8'-apo-beta-carotenal 15,15'-oxygenase
MQQLEKPVVKKTAAEKSALVKNWAKGYQSQNQEYKYWIEEIEGVIPTEIQGTLFRNGPGNFEINGQKFGHIFDGDGMISAITFVEGKARFQNCYVRTEGYLKEQSAGKILYRGFGTQKPGGWLANIFDLKLKNAANTNVIYWGGKLLAMWEGGKPHQLNPYTLDTLGLDDLDGLLELNKSFSAHPRIIDDVLINFGVQGINNQKLVIWEFDRQGHKLKEQSYPLEGFAFLHDMLVTPNYYIFIQHPFKIDSLPFLFGFKSIEQCFSFDQTKPAKIIIISRHQAQKMEIIESDSFFGFHHGNAWEKDGDIYFQSLCSNSYPEMTEDNLDLSKLDYDQFPTGNIYQFKVSLSSKTVTREKLDERGCEFPCVHPNWVGKESRYLYLSVADSTEGGPLQNIMKLDWQSGEKQVWNPSPTAFAGEPVFIPHPTRHGEEEGWIVSLVYDASTHRSYLAILSAQDINHVVAKLHLSHHIPYGFHGSWTSEVFI